MLTACVIFALQLAAEDNHNFEMFLMVIVMGLASKALFNVILVKNFRETMPKIIITVGLLIALFNAAESFNNFTIIKLLKYSTLGLSIAGIGLLSKYYPCVTGAIILVGAALLIWVILKRGFTWGQIGTAVIIGVPLILAGLFLFKGDNKPIEESKINTDVS